MYVNLLFITNRVKNTYTNTPQKFRELDFFKITNKKLKKAEKDKINDFYVIHLKSFSGMVFFVRNINFLNFLRV